MTARKHFPLINKLINEVTNRLPQTNDWLLRDFPEEKMSELPDAIAVILSEATTSVPGALIYKDYEVLNPYQRARFNMRIGRGTSIKPEIPTAFSSWRLIKYNFVHRSMDGNRDVSLHLFVPHFKNGFIIINGKKMVIRKGISETVFSRMDEKGFRGILVRPTRVKLKFEMDEIQPLFSYRDPNVSYGHEFYTRAQIYTGKVKGRSKVKTTDFLYILAEYGLVETLRRLNIDPDEIKFTNEMDDDQDYDFFLARDPNALGLPIYMKIRKGFIVAKDAKEEHSKQFKLQRKTVANLVYLLSHFDFHRINEIDDPTGSIWKTMVGKIIAPKKNDVDARGDAENHFASARGFIDPTTRDRFARFGYSQITDMVSLLEYLYVNINDMMANIVPQDLYQKRIDCTDALLVDRYATPINKNFYNKGHGKSTLKASEVSDILKIKADVVEDIKSSSKSAVETIDTNPTITSDNWLTSCGIHKIRHGGRRDERFDPSMAASESINSLCGKESGRTGMLNPFIAVDEQGKIIKLPWAVELDPIKDFLPRN